MKVHISAGIDDGVSSMLFHKRTLLRCRMSKLVFLYAQNAYGAGYEQEYTALTTVGTVVMDFCRRFSIAFEHCIAKNLGSELHNSQMIAEVRVVCPFLSLILELELHLNSVEQYAQHMTSGSTCYAMQALPYACRCREDKLRTDHF